MEIDINRSCRSCLEGNAIHPLGREAKCFGSVTQDSYMWNMSLAEVIMACTVVNISPDDGLPQSVCTQCLHQIQQAFQFKEKCEAADLKLRHHSLNRTDDPISCIKTETDEVDRMFQPETVLITEFDLDAFDDESRSTVDSDEVVVKRETSTKKHRRDPQGRNSKKRHSNNSTIAKSVTKIKMEQMPDDVDEKTLLEQAEIRDGRYQCKFCEKSLADRQTFRLHIRLHTGTNLKRCTICDRGFAKKNHLERHLATHDKTHKCTFCTRAFLTLGECKEHEKLCKKTKRTELSKVKNEDKTLLPSKSGTENMETEERDAEDDSEDTNGNNDSMGQLMKRESKLDKLVNTDDIRVRAAPIPLDDEEQRLIKSAKMVNDRYSCPLCPRTLARREILILHMRTHTGKNLLRCPVCDKGFAKPYNLSRHMLLHDGNANARMDESIAKAEQPDGSFCCSFCMKSFAERKSFRLHFRMHTENKLHHCPICNQSFTDEDELTQHMPVHGDNFPCIQCDQVFQTFRDRKDHTDTVHTTNVTGSPPTPKLSKAKKLRPPREEVSDDDDDEDEQLVNSAEFVNGRYNCKFCEKTLANRSTLKLHIRLHLQKKLKVCKICEHGFSKNSHLDRHMKTHFPKKPQCKFCHATFESLQEHKAHTASAHRDEIQTSGAIRTAIVPWTQPNGKKSCECRICESVFDSIAALRKHLTWHANTTDWIQAVDLKSRPEYLQMFGELMDPELPNDRIAEMLQLKLRDNSIEVLKMHRITNDQGWELSLTDSETEGEISGDEDNERKRIYNCEECPHSRSFDRLYKLMCHVKADHPSASKQFQCSHCMQCFPNATILKKHLRQQCQNDSKSLHCTMCYSRFTWTSSLASHFAVYHQSESRLLETNKQRRPHSCDQCSKSFYTEQRLAEHQLRHLPKDKRFACDICSKRFSRYDNLRTHMRSHIPPHEREAIAKTHLCSYCGEGFANSSNLNVHIRKHTGERPFKCDICSSRFRRSCDLTCHRRTHTGEKPYPCLVCGHRFSRSNKLVRHMRIHTGERPYKCTECDRAFTQSNDLTLHIRRHTGDKPFSCLCGERFITNSLLQQHRRTHAH